MVAARPLIALNKLGEWRNQDQTLYQIIQELQNKVNSFIGAEDGFVTQQINELAPGIALQQIIQWALTGIAFGFSGVLAGDVSGTQGATSVDKIKGLPIVTGNTTAVNGANQDLGIPACFSVRVIGPSAGFSIGGFTNGFGGRWLFLYNTVAQVMTLNNEDVGSVATNRIRTLTGGNVVLRAGTSAAILVYDSVDTRWILHATN